MAKYKGGDLRNIGDNISKMKTRSLLKKLNRINKRIESGKFKGPTLETQRRLKANVEKDIKKIDKASAGMLATAPRSPITKAVNQLEKIATKSAVGRSSNISPRTQAKIKEKAKQTSLSQSRSPDVFGGPVKTTGMLIREQPSNKAVTTAKRALKNTPRGSDAPSRRPTVGGNMIAATPPGGGTLSKKDVDEYSEAFASPDADKMYNLSEKNRRKDMNMLERAFDSIKVAGDRATAERRKRGLSDYDMNEEEMLYDTLGGAKKGGRVGATMKNTKKSSTRKRAAQRGFGVETRGN
jgi:hypothetical protein